MQDSREAGAALVNLEGGEPTLGRISSFKAFSGSSSETVSWSLDRKQCRTLAQPTLIFCDPSALPSSAGWPLRNILTYLAVRFQVKQVRVICWRSESTSRIFTVSTTSDFVTRPQAVGWEKNASGKLAPSLADLSPMLDPTKYDTARSQLPRLTRFPPRLADQAVDLNLKLMRWRILPTLDLDKVKHTRCLLLGAGTLGCYVARTLMAWGVKKITLVDSATVSFSNPVRQPLFEFQDCLRGGKPKAKAAADALQRIYPNVEAEGLHLSIPMPGHPIPSSSTEAVKEDLAMLEALIDSHDVVYLLMDSRESRWLPTLIGRAKEKVCYYRGYKAAPILPAARHERCARL
jgi:ubiquitin-like modifier-activating enzyme ATG7